VVTNVSTSSIVVSMAGGAAGDFGGFQDCQGKTLAPGDTCHITYQFTPSAAGPDSGSTGGSINGQPFAFNFTGFGVAPKFLITPTRFEFGDVQVGTTSANQQVSVTNVGLAPVVVSMAGGAAGVFGGFQDCQGKTLAVGETCHITYQFTPTVLGPVTGSTSGSINGQPFAFDFSGTGVGLRFLGFVAPTNDTIKAGQMLNAKFALGDANGNAVPDGYAQSLVRDCDVHVTFAGADVCATYDLVTHSFIAQVKTSRSLRVGPYVLAVNVILGGTSVASGSRTVVVR
jgi:hypothetical protein